MQDLSYPNAEVHAIDIGAPLLRYAHARAEALGKKVHFSQQNAEHTHFPDGSFDLIVSHIFPHEIPPFAIRKGALRFRVSVARGGGWLVGRASGWGEALSSVLLHLPRRGRAGNPECFSAPGQG